MRGYLYLGVEPADDAFAKEIDERTRVCADEKIGGNSQIIMKEDKSRG